MKELMKLATRHLAFSINLFQKTDFQNCFLKEFRQIL